MFERSKRCIINVYVSPIEALAAFYAAGVVVATVGGRVAAGKLSVRDQTAARLLLWSVIAGVLWPVVLVGIAEIGVWMLTKAVVRLRSARSVGGEGRKRLIIDATDTRLLARAVMAAADDHDRMT